MSELHDQCEKKKKKKKGIFENENYININIKLRLLAILKRKHEASIHVSFKKRQKAKLPKGEKQGKKFCGPFSQVLLSLFIPSHSLPLSIPNAETKEKESYAKREKKGSFLLAISIESISFH
jgi:hypothetical protein